MIDPFDWMSIFPASIEPDSYLLFSLGKFGFTQPSSRLWLNIFCPSKAAAFR
jgi:hypothetical protein